MIQRFVKSIGSKAFIVRTCWFSNHQPYSFIVTNNSGFYDFDGVPDTEKYRTNPEKFGTCLITKNKNGKHLKDTLPYVKNIAKYFKGAMGIECKSIAADFIKDESGIWWMVSIKRLVTTQKKTRAITRKMDLISKGFDYFGISPNSNNLLSKKKESEYQKSKACKYCGEFYTVNELTKKMTLKMIIALDKHLKHRGWAYSWLDRAEQQYLDISNLYEIHQVCKVCYRLYEEVTKLLDIYSEFSQKIGINMDLEKSTQLISITTLKKPPQELLDVQNAGKRLEKQLLAGNSKNSNSPQASQDITYNIEDHISRSKRPKFLNRFRIIIFIHKLDNIPIKVKTNKNYYLEIHILNQVIQFKLDMSALVLSEREDYKGKKLVLNKLFTRYFFSEGREGLVSYIEQQKYVKMFITTDGKNLGEAEFSLNDFTTEQVPTREYCQNFTGKHIGDPDFYWTWETKVSTFSIY